MRPHHPLAGTVGLPLYGWMRRQGQLELLLILPDGSKSLIPAEWTDFAPTLAPTDQATTIATLRELLRARAQLDVLLGKIEGAQRAEHPAANEIAASASSDGQEARAVTSDPAAEASVSPVEPVRPTRTEERGATKPQDGRA